MKKRIVHKLALTVISSCILVNAYAVGQGFYMGIAMGPATNSANDLEAQTTNPAAPLVAAHPRSMQFGTHVYMGDKFTNYTSFELGFNYFTGIEYDTGGVDTCSGAQLRVRDIDFLIKGETNFSYFEAFVKGGMAVVYNTTSGTLAPALHEQCGVSNYVTRERPIFAIGVGYDFNQNWVMNVTYNEILVGSPVNNVTFYSVGLEYHFVDKYCGQFLCDD